MGLQRSDRDAGLWSAGLFGAELAAFVDRIVGGLSKSAETLSETPVEVTDSSRELRQVERSNVEIVAEEAAPAEPAPVPAAAHLTVAESTEAESTEGEHVSLPHRTHGGALPR
jgi:hypothetical protein